MALSVSLTAVTSLLSLLAMPFNIGWMVAANPVTAAWLTQLSVDTAGIWLSLLLILAIPISLGLLLGWLTGTAMRTEKGGRRAITIEAGMQSSGMALGIIALEFDNDLSMMAFAGLWGIWHYVSALSLAYCWRRQDARGSDLAAAA